MTANTEAPGLDALADQVCADVLGPLPRRDQRRRGTDYVRGLVTTAGRKSIRNIGLACSGPAGDQGLHHLVSGSTWSWDPVRRALRDLVTGPAPVRAWVPRPMAMPRTGRHAVGVRHTPGAASAQHAVGLWAVTAELVTPVEWRLRLDPGWLDDAERRRRASVPDDVRDESDTDAVAAVCAAACGVRPVAPVVVDATDLDPSALLRALRRTRLPLLARVAPDTPVLAADPRTAAGAAEVPAARLLTATAAPRILAGPAGGTAGWVSAVRVRPRSPVRAVGSTRGAPTLLLVGSGPLGRREPDALWLTDLVDESPESLLGLGGGALDAVASRERAASAEAAGVGQYGGRSWEAWHRHTTLASIAHAVHELARRVPARTGVTAGHRRLAG